MTHKGHAIPSKTQLLSYGTPAFAGGLRSSSIELCAGGDAVIRHQQMQLFLAVCKVGLLLRSRCGRSSFGGLVRPLVHVRRLHGRVVQPTLSKICGLTCADIIAEYFGNFNGFVVDPHAQNAELQYMLGK